MDSRNNSTILINNSKEPSDSYIVKRATQITTKLIEHQNDNCKTLRCVLLDNKVSAYEIYLTSDNRTGLIYVMKDQDPYIMEFFARSDKFDQYLPTIMIMLSSFKFLSQ
jgi:hypothetical protein